MTNMNLPIEVFDIFDRKFGREDALALTKSIEVTLSRIEDHTMEFALQRKMEVKEELKVELSSELATKEDLARLEGVTKSDIARLEGVTKSDIARLEGVTKSDIARLEGVTKSDIARLEGSTNLAISKLDKKFTYLWMVTIFTVIFVNQNALEFLAKLLGLLV